MISYIIKDLTAALRYLPVGLAIGGSVFLLLFLINKRMIRKNRQPIPVAALTCLWFYVGIMLCTTVWFRETGSTKIDMEFLATWGINKRNNALVVENVLLFVPYGFLLPWVFERARGFLRTGFWGLLTSVCVEVLQLVTGRGYFQIDDILTNTLGALIGFLVFAIARRILRATGRKHGSE